MTVRFAGLRTMLLVLGALLAVAPASVAQETVSVPSRQYAPEQLEQMLAPVALYPDSLLSDILMAATYPLEVVEADRWLQDPANASLKGDALVSALAQMPWDASVKTLVSFPEVLRMMDDHIDWTEQLGDAFVADQGAMMDAVQRLRQRASANGSLHSTPEQVITWDGPDVVIAPAQPDVVYVPVYDPLSAFGPWPYPGFGPYVFPPYYGGLAVVVVPRLWGWNHWDWRRHRIDIDDDRWRHIERGNDHDRHQPTGTIWVHDQRHRHGVPYVPPRTATAPGQPPRSDVVVSPPSAPRGTQPPATPNWVSPPRHGGGPPPGATPVPESVPRSGVLIGRPNVPPQVAPPQLVPTTIAPSPHVEPVSPRPVTAPPPIPQQFIPHPVPGLAPPPQPYVSPRTPAVSAIPPPPSQPQFVPPQSNQQPPRRLPPQYVPPGGYRGAAPYAPPAQAAPPAGTSAPVQR